ncbi:uncharacterized protein BT62DRAFT_924525 [Guyanagaster necrorhizus]|uniref:Major facilitator superfamily (MFS) profile domain-containing protein n=1 Tax=Guyanagaster necrorhizus TaxID=856835 RepID=A0A9P7VFM7_9AGAR|nr:uncharacterized protein BT62DRAFT_924525 [Guyanagaster necrorhizus MCA 3950]KAG7439697.1 hypothetical protein BT62DRAFT_924525 [Guyanagaster necrorhizus MCA 3950]
MALRESKYINQRVEAAILQLGASGSVLSGFLADRRYSRRLSTFEVCRSALQCGAWKFYHIFINCAVGGLGVGALSMLSPLYMAEISIPELRGSLMALEQFAIVMGVVFNFWFGFFTRLIPCSASWRTPLGIQIVPGLMCWMSIPPYVLVLQGRYEEALASFAKMRRRTRTEAKWDSLIQIGLLEMCAEATLLQRTSPNADDLNIHGILGDLRSWGALFTKYRRSGVKALLYYGPNLMKSIGLSGEKITLLITEEAIVERNGLFLLKIEEQGIVRVGKTYYFRSPSSHMMLYTGYGHP